MTASRSPSSGDARGWRLATVKRCSHPSSFTCSLPSQPHSPRAQLGAQWAAAPQAARAWCSAPPPAQPGSQAAGPAGPGGCSACEGQPGLHTRGRGAWQKRQAVQAGLAERTHDAYVRLEEVVPRGRARHVVRAHGWHGLGRDERGVAQVVRPGECAQGGGGGDGGARVSLGHRAGLAVGLVRAACTHACNTGSSCAAGSPLKPDLKMDGYRDAKSRVATGARYRPSVLCSCWLWPAVVEAAVAARRLWQLCPNQGVQLRSAGNMECTCWLCVCLCPAQEGRGAEHTHCPTPPSSWARASPRAASCPRPCHRTLGCMRKGLSSSWPCGCRPPIRYLRACARVRVRDQQFFFSPKTGRCLSSARKCPLHTPLPPSDAQQQGPGPRHLRLVVDLRVQRTVAGAGAE